MVNNCNIFTIIIVFLQQTINILNLIQLKMKKILLSALLLSVAALGTQAKSWKIGPSSVNGMDFASINAAVASDNVAAGDTLYLDQYYNENQEQTITKQLVIIGTGYDTSLTDEQVVATLTGSITLKANYIQVKSVRLESNVNIYATDCIIDRCFVSGLIRHQSTTAGMNHIYSCYITGRIEGYNDSNRSMQDIQNCIIITNAAQHNINNLTSSIINNNVLYKVFGGNPTNYFCLNGISNSQITNNIINGWSTWNGEHRDYSYDIAASGSGNTIEHNIFGSPSALTYYPTNKIGQRNNWNSFFVCQGNYSDYYRLATESGDNICRDYATDGGECGCHGGMFGCPSGGRPQYIPYFSKVVVGSRTENGKLPVSITVKIQDK